MLKVQSVEKAHLYHSEWEFAQEHLINRDMLVFPSLKNKINCQELPTDSFVNVKLCYIISNFKVK